MKLDSDKIVKALLTCIGLLLLYIGNGIQNDIAELRRNQNIMMRNRAFDTVADMLADKAHLTDEEAAVLEKILELSE